MTQYVINIGTIPNDGTGDPLRTAFNEVNLNFDQVFAAGPVLSNIRIANNTILTTNTNGNIVLAPNGIGVVQSNVSILPNTANIRNLGSANQRWNTVYTQYLDVSANLTISGNIIYNGDLNVAGNLTVNGDLIEVGNIVTDSKTIQLANTAGTTAAANGSGITVGANDLIATYLFNSTANAWTTNIGISAVGNIAAPYFLGNGSQLTGVRADTLVGNTLSSNVLFSSLTSVGTLTNLNVTGNVSAAGNVIGANLETGGLISATGNVIAGNLNTTGSGGNIVLSGGDITGANIISSNIANITGNITAGNVGITGSSLTWANASIIQTSATDVSITGDGQVTIRSLDGTYQWTFDDAGNLTAPGNIGTLANVAADYFIGDGSQLTGIGASYTNADVANLLAAFGSNVINSTGNITTTANISGAYILGDGSQLTNLPVQPGTYSNANVVSLLSAFGSNTISTTGNITAGYILGNGSALTAITGANVTGTVANAAYATAAGSATSATSATTATTANTVTDAAQSNITSVGTLTSLTSSGNIQGGNLLTGGSISATGNVTANYFFGNTIGLTGNITNLDSLNFTVENISALVGNNGVNIGAGGFNNLVVLPTDVLIQNVPLSVTGNVTANYFIGNGSQLTGIVSSYGDSNVTTLLGNFGSNVLSTTGNVTSGNLVTSGIVSATGNVSTTGNVNSGNINTSRAVLGNVGGSSITADGRIFTSGNVVAGNVNSNGIVFSTGNIVGANVNATGNINAGNINTTNLLFSAGNIVGANFDTSGSITALGNITGNYFIGNGSQLTGIVVSGGTSIDNGTSNVTVPVANGNVDINANGTYAWTFGTDGRLTFPGNLVIAGNTSVYGTNRALIQPSDDLPLIALSSGANGAVSSVWVEDIGNVGTSNIAAVYANPTVGSKIVRIVVGQNGVGSGPNLWDFDTTGNLTVPGNIIMTTGIVGSGASPAPYLSGFSSVSAVTVSASGNVTATGNVSGAYVKGNGSELTNLPAPTVTQDITSNGAMSIMTYDGVIKYVNYATVEPASGNITGGNILTGGLISATGNISGNYFIGNGSQLTGISSGVQSSIANGTSNVNIATANGNVTITANASSTWTFDTNESLTLPGGSRLRPLGANLDIFAGTGSYVNLITSDESSSMGVDNGGGYIVTAGGTWNFGTTGNLTAPGNVSAVGNIDTTANVNAANVNFNRAVIGNIGGSSISADGRIFTSGNIVAGNVNSNGILFATGNIVGANINTAGNIFGNVNGYAIGYRDIPQVSFTGNATIDIADTGKHFYSTESTNYILTIANNATQGFQVGSAITVVNQGTGNITVAQGSGVTLYLAGNATSGNRSVATFGMATIMKVATDTWFINGTGVS